MLAESGREVGDGGVVGSDATDRPPRCRASARDATVGEQVARTGERRPRRAVEAVFDRFEVVGPESVFRPSVDANGRAGRERPPVVESRVVRGTGGNPGACDGRADERPEFVVVSDTARALGEPRFGRRVRQRTGTSRGVDGRPERVASRSRGEVGVAEGGALGEPSGGDEQRGRVALVRPLDAVRAGDDAVGLAVGQRVDDRRAAGGRVDEIAVAGAVVPVHDQRAVRERRRAGAGVGVVSVELREGVPHGRPWSRLRI